MIITATQKNTRQTALKVRLVANQVRKLPLMEAVKQLSVIQKRSSLVILKVVRQAIANAVHNHGYSVSELTLKNIIVTPGPTYRRFRAVSRGRAHTVFKRTCHIVVELEAGAAPKAVSKEGTKAEQPVVQAKAATKISEKSEKAVVTDKKSAAKVATKKIAPTKVASQKATLRVRKSGEK